MNIQSAKFIKGLTGSDDILEDGHPHIVFIGRSNVGKSSVINTLVGQKNLARTSSRPGHTQEINIFLVNNSFYLVDFPGYGYAKLPPEKREWVKKMINWYFFKSDYEPKKVILIIDAKVGPTKDDLEVLQRLEEAQKNIVVVANKIDKIKKSEYQEQMTAIIAAVGSHKVIPFSAEKRLGVGLLGLEME